MGVVQVPQARVQWTRSVKVRMENGMVSLQVEVEPTIECFKTKLNVLVASVDGPLVS